MYIDCIMHRNVKLLIITLVDTSGGKYLLFAINKKF